MNKAAILVTMLLIAVISFEMGRRSTEGRIYATHVSAYEHLLRALNHCATQDEMEKVKSALAEVTDSQISNELSIERVSRVTHQLYSNDPSKK